MKIIITGPKGSGKSTLGRKISEIIGIDFIDSDNYIENLFEKESGKKLSCREIYNNSGADKFRRLESDAVAELSNLDWVLIATGGGTMLNPELRNRLRKDSIIIYLNAENDFLWERISKTGLPAFYDVPDGRSRHDERNLKIFESCSHISDIIYTVTGKNESSAHIEISESLTDLFHTSMHSANTFGEIIRVTTFGESHGLAVGAVLDGVKPGIEISEADIQSELDRRKPGQSSVSTQRKEDDTVRILSGVFEGKTTGTPICMVINNKDQDSSKYDALKNVFRPGHADFTFWKKYGIRDHRGGGRSSGRETAGRVCAGAVAKKILSGKNILIYAYALEVAGIRGIKEDFSFIEKNSVRSADPEISALMEQTIVKAKSEKESVGGIVRLVIKNVPAGLGDPVFYKLDARLGMALFSIGAVKGVEFGLGFESAKLKGSENNDRMNPDGFMTNNAGGILGGISNGNDIIANIAVKPTPSIFKNQETINLQGAGENIKIEGRHDPCIVPRIVPVIETMAALVILDAMQIQERISR
jgi:chorismate synthase